MVELLLALFLNDSVAYEQMLYINYITKAAEVRHIDPTGLLMLASCESRLNSDASGDYRSETGEHMARGIFQFWPGTWDTQSKKYGVKGSRLDPYASIDVAASTIADDGAGRWENCNKIARL